MAELHYHGHATFTLVADDGVRIVIDPWFDENPSTELGVDDLDGVDFVLCTHGHSDHFADAVPLAKRTGATLVSSFEIAKFAEEKGVERVHPLSIGGGFTFPFGYVKMTPALHGTAVDGSDGRVSAMPGGFWIDLGGKRLYHAGDTALTKDMELLRGRVEVALLPIGDNFTMGPEDAARAAALIDPEVVIPIHYDTFDLIRQDPEEFRERVGSSARVEILRPGDSYAF